MKALTLFFAVLTLALSACQASSPFDVSDDDGRSLEAARACDPEATPC